MESEAHVEVQNLVARCLNALAERDWDSLTSCLSANASFHIPSRLNESEWLLPWDPTSGSVKTMLERHGLLDFHVMLNETSPQVGVLVLRDTALAWFKVPGRERATRDVIAEFSEGVWRITQFHLRFLDSLAEERAA